MKISAPLKVPSPHLSHAVTPAQAGAGLSSRFKTNLLTLFLCYITSAPLPFTGVLLMTVIKAEGGGRSCG